MKRYLSQIICILLLTVIIAGALGSVAYAQPAPTAGPAPTATPVAPIKTGDVPNGGVTKFLGVPSFAELVSQALASVMDAGLTGMGFILAISGALLNFSINLTLHIRDFVNSTPAIYTTWRSIRDIGGMFIIFFLLYAAIKMILGFDAKFGDLIKNIVIAGVLINFSFFFTGLGIDASNIVSVQIYNAIAPANSLNPSAVTQSVGGISFSSLDGGLSDIFMNHLRVQTVYKQSLSDNAVGGSTPAKIFLAGLIGIFIELFTAVSFAVAAFAFIVRFIILLMLLAFSPLWFALHIFPKGADLGKYASRWTEHYKGMLLFMPVYLLLMYMAMSVLTSSPLLNVSAATNTTPWYAGFLSLGVNAAIVIFLLNMPLVAAISVAGTTMSFINTDKLGVRGIWNRINPNWKGLGSQAGSRTLGRMAYAANQSSTLAKIASVSPIAGQLASSGLSKVSSAGFGGGKKGGYEERLKARTKTREDLDKRIGTLDRSKFGTESEYQEALARRKKMQEKYREHLPWSNKLYTPSGVVGFLVDNRANRQVAFSLKEAAALKDNQAAKNEIDEQIGTVIKEREEDLKEQLKTVSPPENANDELRRIYNSTMTPEDRAKKADLQKRLDVLKAAKKEYNAKMEGLEDALGKAAKARADELDKKGQLISAAIGRVTKKNKTQDVLSAFKTISEETGGSKEEKKEEGGGGGEKAA